MGFKEKGIKEITETLDEVSIKKDALIKDILQTASESFLNLVRKKVPIDTGQYKKSWGILDKKQKSYIVGTNQKEFFQRLEFGTNPHQITPTNASALHFTVGGTEVFAKVVQHPGGKPIPHFRPAFERFKTIFPMIVQGKVAAHWKLFKGTAKGQATQYNKKDTKRGVETKQFRRTAI